MTQNREDYIKAIFKIAEREGEASNQRIADSLEVSRASASEMVKKLIQEGFVVAEGRQLSLSDRQTHFKQTPFVGKLFDDQASI